MSKQLLLAACVVGAIAVPGMSYGQPSDDPAVAPSVDPAAAPAEDNVNKAPDTAEVKELDVGQILYEIVKDIRGGNMRHVAVGVLLLLMFALRKLRNKLKIFRGDRGGSILVMLLALGGAFSTTLATSQPIDFKMVLSTAIMAFTAVGGYTWVKKMIWPKD